MKWMEELVNFLFPPHCPICNAYVETRGGWCESCLKQTLEVHCLALEPAMREVIAEARALGRYRGGLRDLLRELKYRKKRDRLFYAATLQKAADPVLAEFFRKQLTAVPVPLHEKKEKERGFNQADILFRDWLEEKKIPMERLLIRCRVTSPQFGLGAKERRENMKGAFAPAPGAEIRGKDILLVDDILTTGATLYECAKVLKQQGAGAVYVMVMASDRE